MPLKVNRILVRCLALPLALTVMVLTISCSTNGNKKLADGFPIDSERGQYSFAE